MYQTPTPVGANLHRPSATVLAHQHPCQLTPVKVSPQDALKRIPPSPAAARAKAALTSNRGSPLLIRAGQVRAPGSPNSARKPPPPAPPVRGVTRKDGPPSSDSNSIPKPTAQVTPSSLQQPQDKPRGAPQSKDDRMSNGLEKSNKGETQDYLDAVDDQVCDTVLHVVLVKLIFIYLLLIKAV